MQMNPIYGKHDENTLAQFNDVMSRAEKGVLCADGHLGYVMPIGGVAAYKNKVSPVGVGFDIGCVDCDTEFLSPEGWVKISEYKNQKVMQFNMENNTSEFVVPLRYVKEPCKTKFIHFKTKYGIDQMLSYDHRCLVYKYGKEYLFQKTEILTAKEIADKHFSTSNGFRHRFLTSFIPKIKTKIPLTDDQIRVMVMVCADSSLNKTGNKCIVSVKKIRKVIRIRYLLKKAKVPITYFREDGRGYSTFTFVPPIFKKGLHQFWKASYSQLKIIGEEFTFFIYN